MIPRHPILLGLVVAVFATTLAPAAGACPNCRGGIAEDEKSEKADTSAGFAWSIIAMLSIVGLLAGSVVRMIVRIAKAEAAAAPGLPDPNDPPSGA